MKHYKNYIFDLYNTLIDMRTDEEKPALWRQMAALYAANGADYTGPAFKKRYKEMVAEEEAALATERGVRYPEIKLEKVFTRLLTEAPKRHDVFEPNESGQAKKIDTEKFAEYMALTFRTLSRGHMKPFPHTIATLKALKKQGCGVFLLSNAQRTFTQSELELTGLLPLFDQIYISSDAGVRKPEPVFMMKLLTEHSLNPDDFVMIGDDFTTDAGVAAECGVHAIILNSWHLEKKELKKRLKTAQTGDALSPAARTFLTKNPPEIVESGDIAELLN